jgi:hypothetical protein
MRTTVCIVPSRLLVHEVINHGACRSAPFMRTPRPAAASITSVILNVLVRLQTPSSSLILIKRDLTIIAPIWPRPCKEDQSLWLQILWYDSQRGTRYILLLQKGEMKSFIQIYFYTACSDPEHLCRPLGAGLGRGTCPTEQQDFLNDKHFTSTKLAALWGGLGGGGLPNWATRNSQL